MTIYSGFTYEKWWIFPWLCKRLPCRVGFCCLLRRLTANCSLDVCIGISRWVKHRSVIGRSPSHGAPGVAPLLGNHEPGNLRKNGGVGKKWGYPQLYIIHVMDFPWNLYHLLWGKKTTCEFSIAMLVYQVVPRVFRSKAFFSQPWMTSVTFPWQTSWTSWFWTVKNVNCYHLII